MFGRKEREPSDLLWFSASPFSVQQKELRKGWIRTSVENHGQKKKNEAASISLSLQSKERINILMKGDTEQKCARSWNLQISTSASSF